MIVLSEFCNLLSGLMHDTPLGSVVSIRSETDSEIIKNLLPSKKNKSDWDLRQIEELKRIQTHIEIILKRCGGEGI